jgi:acyl-CoA reductase-like NAD-dependent aldehyde dehydrogenase
MLVEAMLSTCALPNGALQILHGGPEVGKALVNDSRIKCVQFTGTYFHLSLGLSLMHNPF